MSQKLKVLYQAVYHNELMEAAALLHRNNVNYMDPSSGLSLLALAVSLGYREMTHLLLQRGASIELRDRMGFEPLHRAVWFGHEDLVRLLLEKGADPLCRNRRNDKTPLALAAMRGHVEIAKLLLSSRLRRGDSAADETDLDFRDADGRSALDIAAASGKRDIVEHLLLSGADAYFSRICANEGAEGAKTWDERRSYDEINRLLCQAWSSQSQVSM